jgi:hypothetical protein
LPTLTALGIPGRAVTPFIGWLEREGVPTWGTPLGNARRAGGLLHGLMDLMTFPQELKKLILHPQTAFFQFHHVIIRVHFHLGFTAQYVLIDRIVLFKEFGKMAICRFQRLNAVLKPWQFVNQIMLFA